MERWHSKLCQGALSHCWIWFSSPTPFPSARLNLQEGLIFVSHNLQLTSEQTPPRWELRRDLGDSAVFKNPRISHNPLLCSVTLLDQKYPGILWDNDTNRLCWCPIKSKWFGSGPAQQSRLGVVPSLSATCAPAGFWVRRCLGGVFVVWNPTLRRITANQRIFLNFNCLFINNYFI